MNQNTLNNNHSPAYWMLRQKWVDALNMYEPVTGVLSQYLVRYPKEDDAEYAERVRRLIQINVVKVVLDFYTAMIFSNPPQVQYSDEYADVVEAFRADCDGRGTSLDQYIRRQVAPQGLLFGSCDVFVDLKRSAQPASSLAEQRDLGLHHPYCYVVPPLNRVKWKLNDAGEYEFYQSQDKLNTEIQPSYQLKEEKQWQIWTPEKVERYKVDGSRVSDEGNPYGFIPAVAVVLLPSIRFQGDAIGISLVDDVVPIQQDILNKLSLITDYHVQTNYQLLHLKLDDNAINDMGEAKEISSKRALVTYGSASDAKYVGPNPDGAREMREHLKELIDSVYQMKYLPVDGSDVKSHTSSETIKTTMALLYNALSDICRSLEAVYTRILCMAVEVAGGDSEAADIRVQWNTDFSFEALSTNLQNLKTFRDTVQDISKTAVAEYAKRIVTAELSRSRKLDTINDEIDAFGEGETTANAEDTNTPPSDAQVGNGGNKERMNG